MFQVALVKTEGNGVLLLLLSQLMRPPHIMQTNARYCQTEGMVWSDQQTQGMLRSAKQTARVQCVRPWHTHIVKLGWPLPAVVRPRIVGPAECNRRFLFIFVQVIPGPVPEVERPQ